MKRIFCWFFGHLGGYPDYKWTDEDECFLHTVCPRCGEDWAMYMGKLKDFE